MSGKTRCEIKPGVVLCQAGFTNSPIMDGGHADGASVTSAGDFSWSIGDLGNFFGTQIGYQTYSAFGWTIDASSAGTRFTNDNNGHGMFVSIENVYGF